MNHRPIACFLGLLCLVASSPGPLPAEGASPVTTVSTASDTHPYTAVVATGEDVEIEILSTAPGVLMTSGIFALSVSPSLLIGTNRDEGTVATLGRFPAGSELVFGIATSDGNAYVTGVGERNPDGIVHAIVEADGPGTVTVRFEDL